MKDLVDLVARVITDESNLARLQEEFNLLKRKLEIAESKCRNSKRILAESLSDDLPYFFTINNQSYMVKRDEYYRVTVKEAREVK